MERNAVYAGSFDPVTNGHLNIIERAAGMYDSLTVTIVVNPNKSGFFTVDERADIVREAVRHLNNVKVDTFSGLLADYINAHGFTAYVRGLRSALDFESEFQMAHMNDLLFTEGTETVFLMSAPEHSFISSSLVKEVARLGGNIGALVPDHVSDRIKEKLAQK